MEDAAAATSEVAASPTRRPTKISFLLDDRAGVKGRLPDEELDEILLGDPSLLELWYRPEGDFYVLSPPRYY